MVRAYSAPAKSKGRITIGKHRSDGNTALYIIELTRGTMWRHSMEQIDRREYQTDNINAAIAEARYWLLRVQKEHPQRGATHFQVVSPSGTVVGGP